MNIQKIEVKTVGEQYFQVAHPSGLTLLLMPTQRFSTTYAQFSTRYGSLDSQFRQKGEDEFTKVPQGIAHFLEHKLFEDEDGDAFLKFAQTGAGANAFTSFDRTSYEFTCSSDFLKNLEILIHMVTTPCFSAESVAKEQGIIAQEIKMYQDVPNWCSYFNLLRALYHNHPVTIDIAGTVDSILEIDKPLLDTCYNAFYNLRNMVLTIAGRFEIDQVIALCDKLLPAAPVMALERGEVAEPLSIKTALVEAVMPVAVPIFEIGFKNAPLSPEERGKALAVHDILLELLAGGSSPLFTKLYETGLLTSSLDYYGFEERGVFCSVFSGESADPLGVQDLLLEEIDRLRRDGIDQAAFLRLKKFFYGKILMSFTGGAEPLAHALTDSFIEERPPFEAAEVYPTIEKADVEAALATYFGRAQMAISIIWPDEISKNARGGQGQ